MSYMAFLVWSFRISTTSVYLVGIFLGGAIAKRLLTTATPSITDINLCWMGSILFLVSILITQKTFSLLAEGELLRKVSLQLFIAGSGFATICMSMAVGHLTRILAHDNMELAITLWGIMTSGFFALIAGSICVVVIIEEIKTWYAQRNLKNS